MPVALDLKHDVHEPHALQRLMKVLGGAASASCGRCARALTVPSRVPGKISPAPPPTRGIAKRERLNGVQYDHDLPIKVALLRSEVGKLPRPPAWNPGRIIWKMNRWSSETLIPKRLPVPGIR